jgi:hypothetical protein
MLDAGNSLNQEQSGVQLSACCVIGLGFARVDAEYAAVDQHQELTRILFDKIRLMIEIVLSQLIQGSTHA